MEQKSVKVGFAETDTPVNNIYANFVLTNRSNEEIVIDFGYIDPFTIAKSKKDQLIEASHVSRVIMTATTAKRLSKQIEKVLESMHEKDKK